MGSVAGLPVLHSDVRFHVTAGVHQGVSIPLEGMAWRIGSTSECDLMLSDAGVAANHATLRLERSAVLIEATGGPVTVVRGPHIPVGHGARVSLPAELQLGDARVKLSGRQARRSTRINIPGGRWIAGSAVLSLIFIAAVNAGAGGMFQPRQELAALGAVRTAQATDPIETSTALATNSPETALAEKLQSKGLDHLTVDTDGARLIVTGSLPPQRHNDWVDIQKWFDQTYGRTHVLASEVGPEAPKMKPRFNLQAIWFGETPYAVAANGARLYPGAVLQDGWVIKDISSGRMVVRKNDEEFTLTF
ncbi:hypothetical protein ATN84_20345 [Paramesorhizobium deserti]|uniref:FHA domain-containing protein n=1 Tax=Paramesorhizobium deserti TaxID=1494590 RepID=A0A135HP96_9HYPH|nr:FHA domain-containing protein [Paramesorhizobium deserti]KXF75041.1 hypothetical protein ATN84_20345 [Paramesorhizobium deserti]